MFCYYVSDALRNIIRARLYTIINVAGLAIGLACVILIGLFVRDELSYDKWIPDTRNLYRIEVTTRIPGLPPIVGTASPFPLANFIKERIPQAVAVTHFSLQHMTVNTGEHQFLEEVGEVDPNFFEVIKLPFVTGSPAYSLAQPESAVITESAARKYFGRSNPVGKVIGIAKAACGPEHISCSTEEPLRVTGVIRDLPHNTQLSAQIFLPHTSVVDRIQTPGKQDWLNLSALSYVRFKAGTDPKVVLGDLNQQLDRNVDLKNEAGTDTPVSQIIQTRLVPFLDVHLGTVDHVGGVAPGGSWTVIYGLCVIALLILAIAGFNFMNLATARAALRSREMALRKCMGASRLQLIAPLLMESMIMAAVAFLFALSMVEVFLPVYSAFLQRPMVLDYVGDWRFFGLMLSVALITGLISGLYPAFILSGFQPGFVLRASASGHIATRSLRATLVVLQFGISIGLAIVALVVFSQINYARHIDMGFRFNDVVTIDAQRRLTEEQRDVFAKVLRSNRRILGVAMSSYAPFTGAPEAGRAQVPGESRNVAVDDVAITPNFPELYGMRLLAGRVFSERRPEDRMVRGPSAANDGHSVLVNAMAASKFGFSPERALGRRIQFNGNTVRIVGVLGDARMDSAMRPVRPTVFLFDRANATTVSVWISPNTQMTGNDQSDPISFIDEQWHYFAPTVAISRSSLGESFDKLYAIDEKQGQIFSVFVAIAMFIACMGLFGLASFTAARRTKEIGIRKVFGARSRDIIWLLLWQFSIPVLIANLIAWPVAWYYLHVWLDGFADRVSLSPLYFLGPAVGAMAIAWVTVFAHARQVAGASPIHALRYE
jgi:putative ABC transport system permease protein